MSQKISIGRLQEMKVAGEKICSLTAYDASFAYILDEAGVEIVLVGDSLGMVLQGESDTLSVSMDAMVYHTKIVSSMCQSALLVADMPHRSYESTGQALENALRLQDEAGADVVKLEIVGRSPVNHRVPEPGHRNPRPHQCQWWGC